MSTALTVGAFSAGALAVRDSMKEQDRDIRDAERTAEQARQSVSRMMRNGGVLRTLVPAVGDLLAGVAYPSQSPTVPAGPLIVSPSATPRPVLASEGLVLGASYPPRVNEYTSNGDLVEPADAMDGQLVAVGMALTLPEVRATLLGLTSKTPPTDDDVLNAFRHNQALVQVLQELRDANGGSASLMSVFVAAWRRFFGISAPQPGAPASPYPKGLIWSLQGDTAPIAATAWAEALQVPFFANLLAVGEAARLRLFSAPLTAAAAPDLSLRVSIAGTVVGSFVYTAAEALAGVCLELDVTRRADQSNLGRYAAGFKASAKASSLTQPAGLFFMNAPVDNAILVEAMWSAAGANAVMFREGTLEKL